jgi:hypothetical protein
MKSLTRETWMILLNLSVQILNGKIVGHRGLANEFDFMRQLGVVMEPK